MPRLVRDQCRHGAWIGNEGHHCDARIVLIGEAGGKREDETGLPFQGASGALLYDWWRDVGLERDDIYITNVVRRKPPGNVIEAVPWEEKQEGIKSLHERLAQLADPVVIVPTGNTSLSGLLGNHLGPSALKISDWRGSILQYTDLKGRAIKTIPSFHPAATFKQPILTKFCKADWGRIAKDSFFKELRLPERTHIIDPSEEQIKEFIDYATRLWPAYLDDKGCFGDSGEPPPAMAIDVENSMTGDYFKELTCVGFSFRPDISLTISTLRSDYGSDLDYRSAWFSIRELCGLAIPKVGQNFLTDAFKLLTVEVPVVNYIWDLMEMDHALDPNDGGDTDKGNEEAVKDKTFKMEMRSLRVLQSLYSRSPFHKLEGKSPDRVQQLRYNGKDCCEERQIYEPLWLALKAAGRL